MQLNEHTNKQFISKLPKRGNNVQKTDEINMSRDRTGRDRTGTQIKQSSVVFCVAAKTND